MGRDMLVVRCGIGALALAASTACSGPQRPSVAIQPSDEAEYTSMLGAGRGSPREAFLRERAKTLGVPPEEAAARDSRLSEEVNPFAARRDQGAVSRGAVIFVHECAGCHGENADGKGKDTPVPLAGADFHRTPLRMDITFHGGPAAKWFRTINDGVNVQEKGPDGTPVALAMPPFSQRLSREQIWLTVTYLQSVDADAPTAPAESPR